MVDGKCGECGVGAPRFSLTLVSSSRRSAFSSRNLRCAASSRSRCLWVTSSRARWARCASTAASASAVACSCLALSVRVIKSFAFGREGDLATGASRRALLARASPCLTCLNSRSPENEPPCTELELSSSAGCCCSTRSNSEAGAFCGVL